MENQNTEINPQVNSPAAPASVTYEGTEFAPAYVARFSKEEWAEHGKPRFYTEQSEPVQRKMLNRVWELSQPAGKAAKK